MAYDFYVQTKRDLIDAVQEYGVVPYFASAIPGFSLEEVVDDMVATLKDFHIGRLQEGKCSIEAGTCFLNLLAEIERISDVCSNIGISTITRVRPDLANRTHEYSSALHRGNDAQFNTEYHAAHDEFFGRLRAADAAGEEDGAQTSLFDQA